jgi:photosystem II stability/assembly factor-like uncharacterized protein
MLNSACLIPECLSDTGWQAIGPFGGDVRTIAIDPANGQTVYAGAYGGGVFKSTNGGASWTSIGNGITSKSVTSLAIDPINSQTVYAGTEGGFFKSTDGGSSWSASNSGTTDSGIESLAIDPTNVQTIYLGTTGGRVFKSVNGGASWTPSNTGLIANKPVWSLAVDSKNGLRVFAGTDAGIFQSSNGGASWTTANSAMTNIRVQSLAIAHSNSQTVYAGTLNLGAVGKGAFKTTDGGVSWTAINTGMTNGYVFSIAIDPNNNQTIYAGTGGGGVFKSTNAGASWTAVNSGLTNGSAATVAIDPNDSGTLYSGTPGGVFKSANSGASWAATSSDMTSSRILALAVDPSNSQNVYAGSYNGGFFMTGNGGVQWTPISSSVITTDVWSLAVDPGNGRIIYAGTGGNGLVKSTDGGVSWATVNNGMTFPYVSSIVIAPANSQAVYAGTNGGGLFKSTDGGSSWSAINSGLTNLAVQTVALDPGDPLTMYAGTNGGGLFKSINGGSSWTAANSGLTNLVVQSVAIDPSNGQSVYAATLSGVFKSSNRGASWISINSGITGSYTRILAVDPSNSQTVYLGTTGGLFKTTDAGASWAAVGGSISGTDVLTLAVAATNSQTVYAGTNGNGGYKTLFSDGVPAITSASSAVFSAGSAGSFRVTSSGWPAPQFIVSGAVPAGLSFDPASGILSGTPAAGGAGTYQLMVTASNGIPPDAVRGLTLTVLPASPLSIAIHSPSGATGLSSLTTISGTASGATLFLVEVQVCDGSYYLQPNGSFSTTPAWLGAAGTTSWSLNTLAVAWREGITYTVQARASDGSTSSAPASSPFTISTSKTGSVLSMSLTPNTLRAGDSAVISGRLAKADTGALPGQTVTLLVTPPATATVPNPAAVVTSLSTDGSGNFSSGPLFQSAIPGVYLVQARFEGTGFFAASFASRVLPVTPQSGYAIIVVGKASDQSLLEEHTATADGIYATLVGKRGFLPANIDYLKSTASAAVTKQQIEDAISQMKAKYAAAPAPFYLFLIDHGSQTGFVLGDSTPALTLAPSELAPWLDDFENGVSSDILAAYPRFLIIGSCYSGAFVPQLSKPGRVIVTSAGAGEQSLAGFSIFNSAAGATFYGGEYFIDNMINFLGRGDDFKDAVLESSSNVALRDPRTAAPGLHSGVYDTLAQHPLLDDNGDGMAGYMPLSTSDGVLAANLSLGVGIKSLGEPADITGVAGTFILPTTQTGDAPLWLRVNDNSRIAKAWMEIRTPVTGVSGNGGTGQVIPQLVTRPLYYDGLSWNGSYSFPNNGTYNILYYTQDNQTGDISPTAHSTVYRQLAGNPAPSSFSLSSPADEGSVGTTFPLTWQEVTSNNSITYTLLVATDQNFGSVVYKEENIPQAATYIADGKLKNPSTGSYYCQNGDSYCFWKVQAIDSYGAIRESNTRSFTVVATNSLMALIDGYVRDGITGAPVAGAKISSGSASLNSLANGFYFVQAPAGSLSLTVSATGYNPKTFGIIATSGAVVKNDLVLQPVSGKKGSSITVSVPAPAAASFGTQFTVAASASSGLPVSYSSGSSTVCTSNGASFTMLASSGACLVQYDQTGDGNYAQAPRVTNSTSAGKATLTVSADNQSRAFNSANPTLTASYAGFVGADTKAVLSGAAAISTGATQASPAGSYPITIARGTLSAANYSFALVNGTLSVTNGSKPGDCNGDGTVTIAEVQSAINMFLGLKPVQACVDQDNSGVVTISEVQKVINAFLGL